MQQPERSHLFGKPLSKREAEVETLALEGHTAKDIAGILGIAEKTVEVHRNSIYRKRGVSSRIQLAAAAVMRGEEWKLNGGRISTLQGLA